jgi:hypothetical protein
MEDLKLLLIDRLKSQGMDPALIPAFLKALTSIIIIEPGINVVQVNQKLNLLGCHSVASVASGRTALTV